MIIFKINVFFFFFYFYFYSLTFGGFSFCSLSLSLSLSLFTSLLPTLELSKPHACVVCIALPTSLVVVPTQGFCFVFFFVVFLRKKVCFGSEWVARDKSVFGMEKHGHVSFQILTRDFYSLDFGTKPLTRP